MDTVKPFLSIDDQIKLLKKRKLTINDDQYEKAKEFLLNNNYYRISGYSLTLLFKLSHSVPKLTVLPVRQLPDIMTISL